MSRRLLHRAFSRALFAGQIRRPKCFVLGNQKSGTSAIGNLISIASGLSYGQDVLYFSGKPLIDSLHDGSLSISELKRKHPYVFAYGVVKDPNLAFWTQDLSLRFPSARQVAIVRDPFQNIRSIFNRFNLDGRTTRLDRTQLEGSVAERWIQYLEGHYHGHSDPNPVKVMALRWSSMNQSILQNANSIKIVKYEDFVRDKTSTIQDVLKHLELKQVHAIEQHVNTQFQPAGDPNLNLNEFFGAENLQVIRSVCGPAANKLKYEWTHNEC